MAKKIYVYKKEDESIDQITQLLERFFPEYVPDYDLFSDTEGEYLALAQLKESILQNKGILIVSSINNLGENKDDVFEVLNWLKANRIATIFADYPSTQIFDNPIENAIILNVILDMYKQLVDNRSYVIRPTNTQPAGRKRIEYPDNWEEIFNAWVNKELTIKEILEKSGLSKGTFYNLAKKYKESNESSEE